MADEFVIITTLWIPVGLIIANITALWVGPTDKPIRLMLFCTLIWPMIFLGVIFFIIGWTVCKPVDMYVRKINGTSPFTRK